ncbi:hypothetical protein GH714_024732 [Hevea brasiliensis]|uniref:Uncharacterized protein n=1 Tax=Hevea brasiliensis TaxID=3981 RepID=A0A6A6M3H0_HEVBR|nr:hypothetical protein GH714_024732 [Hevea brasiliensis]
MLLLSPGRSNFGCHRILNLGQLRRFCRNRLGQRKETEQRSDIVARLGLWGRYCINLPAVENRAEKTGEEIGIFMFSLLVQGLIPEKPGKVVKDTSGKYNYEGINWPWMLQENYDFESPTSVAVSLDPDRFLSMSFNFNRT